MHAKKLLGVGIIVCSLLVLTGCGKAISTDSTDQDVVTTDTINTGEETTPTRTNTILGRNSATKAQCIEIMAYALKGVQNKSQDSFLLWAKKLEDLQKTYGLEGKKFEDICKEYITPDANFINAVQKRMTELK